MEQTDKNYESNRFEQHNKLDQTNTYRTCTQQQQSTHFFPQERMEH